MINIGTLAGHRLYLDTNVFIYFVEGHARFRRLLELLFEAIDAKMLAAVTSELTLAEVLVKPLSDGKQEAAHAYMELLSAGSNLTMAPIDRTTLIRAAELRAQINDAIHLATAELRSCDWFLTEDMRIRVPDGLQLKHLSELVAQS
jgi:predicted nucleic acid-binding protein